MRESTLSKIEMLFKHKIKKGTNGSMAVMEILKSKAFFPKIDNEDIFDLWAVCQNNGYDIENISRLSTIEHQGFKVNQKVADLGLRIKEQSIFEKTKKDEILFDISKTTLPYRLSRAYQIKNFKSTQELCESIKNSYFKNSGLKLVKSEDDKASVDFYNKTVFYASLQVKDELSSILKTIVLAESVKTQEKYDEALENKAKGNMLKTQIILAANAVLSSVGLEEQKSKISAEFQKNYVWGRDSQDVFANINALSNIVARVMYVSDLEACFLSEYARQSDEKRQVDLKSSSTIDYSSLNQALDDERSRIIDVIKQSVDIAEVIRDYADVDITGRGERLTSLCVSPDHSDTEPSLSISNAKGVCHCFSCKFSGDHIKVVRAVTGKNFKDAVDDLASRYNINTNYDFIKSQFNMNNSKNEFVHRILSKYKEAITNKEYNSLLYMDIPSLKAFDIKKAEELEKQKVYEIKEQREPIAQNTAKAVKGYIKDSYLLESNRDALRYIQETRRLTRFPPELKVLNCRHTSDEGKTSFHMLVGFVNSKGGTDGKYFAGDIMGRPRSVGEKAITVLNDKNLSKENPNFIVVESQWDLVAFYNDPVGKNVYENSVAVVLNGTGGADEAKMFIDKYKGRYSSLIVLNQADEPNQKAMNSIVFGTGITRHTHIAYSDAELDAKADVNDLLKAGEKISERFSSDLRAYESDVVLAARSERRYEVVKR